MLSKLMSVLLFSFVHASVLATECYNCRSSVVLSDERNLDECYWAINGSIPVTKCHGSCYFFQFEVTVQQNIYLREPNQDRLPTRLSKEKELIHTVRSCEPPTDKKCQELATIDEWPGLCGWVSDYGTLLCTTCDEDLCNAAVKTRSVIFPVIFLTWSCITMF